MLDSYAAIFARRADSYCRAMNHHPHARDAEFGAVVDPLDPAARIVIDMPAGGGWLRRYLRAGIHYIAIEPAELFFDLCPQDASADRLRAPVEAVPLPDAAADAIVSLAGLHHAPDLGAIFAEAHRLLRSGGQFVIADVAAGSREDDFLNRYVHAHNPMGHEGVFLDDGTAGLLRRAGFEVLAEEQAPTPWRLGSAEQAGAYCADLFGIEGQTPAQVAAALQEIVGAVQGGDGFVLGWSLRRLICRKR
ncbi:methyltransferase domain-containing protein [Sphingomonas histidinilytica]|uniref:Methyltransferase domain-containing protein n=1 Tax=Rhizorhabdus histidinilytica TaxID=439228 RepID=A0A1T5AKW4_9SPHN|nr:class I SAM-dependent methyltransferase [Rhizorhabdus histidinilytica]MBO9376775.1 methyltransferase domain-containing protein [Rhizorhabdus histidinilytica]SKB35447.1 Methyltransferase domain-containing protein [Rhizorhabdus histidinilytica]